MISAADYRCLQTQIAFDHPWVRITVDTLEYAGRSAPYIYLESPVEAVATVAVSADGQVALTRQYRHPVRQVILDLPAGRLEPGETPLDGARRELEEETGLRAGQWTPLGRYNQFPGMLKAATNLFLALDLTPGEPHRDPGEYLEVVWLPFTEAVARARRGEFIDGSLQLGLLLAEPLLRPPGSPK